RLFLLTLAVADDVASLVLLVGFSAGQVRAGWLVAAVAATAISLVVGRLPPLGRVGNVLTPTVFCLTAGALAWWALIEGGVEAAVIGAVVPLGLPRAARRQATPLQTRKVEQHLGAGVNTLVLPVFALANGGLALRASVLTAPGALRVMAAVAAARVVGKPLGIVLGASLATGRGWPRRGDDVEQSPQRAGGRFDPGLSSRSLIGGGALAGVGFTVPLLMIRTVFGDGPLASGATLGLLAGSVLGAIIGALVLRHAKAPPADQGPRSVAPP
ncbi:MAG: Na+/H+ antiporter NhaA, partial [Acidimicrobiales bacterium]